MENAASSYREGAVLVSGQHCSMCLDKEMASVTKGLLMIGMAGFIDTKCYVDGTGITECVKNII